MHTPEVDTTGAHREVLPLDAVNASASADAQEMDVRSMTQAEREDSVNEVCT